MAKLQYYVGVKDKGRAWIFRTGEELTSENHPDGVRFCFGGYPTRKKAEEVAMYQNYGLDNDWRKSIPVWVYEPKAEFYHRQVMRLGKFEGEARYVPYFWDIYLDGGADKDDGKVLTFYVTAEDKAIFPELRQRKAIKLYEREDGFVVEVK